MGEGERIDAFVAKDGVIQSKSYATLPSPVGRERVRVRVLFSVSIIPFGY
jgi:hypothetical protein